MKKFYIKVGFIIIGLITLTLGTYTINNAVHADEASNVFEIFFSGNVDQITTLNIRVDDIASFTVFNDNSLSSAGPLMVRLNPNLMNIESNVPYCQIELQSKDYIFSPSIITLDSSMSTLNNVRADYAPNHLTQHSVLVTDSSDIEKTSFEHDETAKVSFRTSYPNYVVYYSLQDEGSWQEAINGEISVNAASNQAQDRIIEYRFAGYYENETPPTLNDLQDSQYLESITVHFNADDAANEPGIDDNDPDDPTIDNPGNDDNDASDPNPDNPENDDNNPDDSIPDYTNTDDDNDDSGNLNPDNSEIDNNDPDNDNSNSDYTQPDNNVTGANTGDYTNAILWIMTGVVGYFCIVYPIRKRMNEQN